MNNEEGWFYVDCNDATTVHGPFDVSDLKQWYEAGEFLVDHRVRQGRHGDDVLLRTLIDALPRGWSQHLSHEDNDVYYQNDYTLDTTWDKPTLPAAPEGWSVLVDESNDDQHYYQHNATGNTQWEHPHDADHANE